MDTPAPSAFQEVCRIIGPYSAIGRLFDPLVSPQAVSKWADSGVPPERVLALARATGYRVTPHHIRPDLYPFPEDGIPDEFRQAAAA